MVNNIPIDKHELALFGFYYVSGVDLVKCHFCRVEIGMWQEDDDVLTEHERWSPSCPLIRGLPTNNVPIDANALNSALAVDHVVQGPFILFSDFFRFFGLPATTSSAPSCLPNNILHGAYMLESDRLKSYENWPQGLSQKPTDLSDAGFYYTGVGDKVICFSCGGGIQNWLPGDIPWEQHGMLYESCHYLNQAKGAAFIKEMHEKKLARDAGLDTNSVHENVTNAVEDETDDIELESLCKVCLNERYNTVFIPCGHVCACVKCAFSVATCPICRQPHKNVVKLYFP